jgi:hypothetical protein
MKSVSYEYVVNQKLEHVDDISFRELFGRIRVHFYKIRSVPSYHKVFVSSLVIPLYEIQFDQLP